MMQIICAWCQKHLGWCPGEGISHGICSACLKEQERQLAEMERVKR